MKWLSRLLGMPEETPPIEVETEHGVTTSRPRVTGKCKRCRTLFDRVPDAESPELCTRCYLKLNHLTGHGAWSTRHSAEQKANDTLRFVRHKGKLPK